MPTTACPGFAVIHVVLVVAVFVVGVIVVLCHINPCSNVFPGHMANLIILKETKNIVFFFRKTELLL